MSNNYRNKKRNHTVKQLVLMIALTIAATFQVSMAQDIEQIRWKSEDDVRAEFGQPNSIQGPIGTHASYTLWKYDDFTVAFANNRAFHLFNKASLRKEVEIQENQSTDY